jgi:hypothetical protein
MERSKQELASGDELGSAGTAPAEPNTLRGSRGLSSPILDPIGRTGALEHDGLFAAGSERQPSHYWMPCLQRGQVSSVFLTAARTRSSEGK